MNYIYRLELTRVLGGFCYTLIIMKIFICASKHLYNRVALIKETLEKKGHIITLPNSYDNPQKEE